MYLTGLKRLTPLIASNSTNLCEAKVVKKWLFVHHKLGKMRNELSDFPVIGLGLSCMVLTAIEIGK